MEIETITARQIMPPMGLIIGGPKVGKSTFCSTIPDALIIDLEGNGYDHIGAESIVRPKTHKEVLEVFKFYFESDKFKMLVVDHARELTNHFSSQIAKEAGVKMIDQIGFGKGTNELRHDVYSFLKKLRTRASENKRVILVAHSTDRNGQVRLDVDGKLDTMITGMVDYIGQIYRAGPENYVNFTSQTGSESGCRNKNLANYNGVANWSEIVKVANQ